MYHNPYSAGYEVLSKSGYFTGQSASAPSYHFTNDFPDYAAMFYSPTNHEVMTSIRYGNFEPGYDNLNEIRDSLIAPMEFYMPSASFEFDGVGKQNSLIRIPKAKDRLMEKINKEIFDEIKKAQRESSGKPNEQEFSRRIRRIEVEDILLLRRIRKTLIFDEKEEVI